MIYIVCISVPDGDPCIKYYSIAVFFLNSILYTLNNKK